MESRSILVAGSIAALFAGLAAPGYGQEAATNSAAPPIVKTAAPSDDWWNWHVQNTDIVQGNFAFPAQYSGPNSLANGGQIRETVSFDLLAGIRLWRGAEAHVDGLVWQGFGLSDAVGVEGFPNGEAFRLGTRAPNINPTRVFIRQTIGFGGAQEEVADDAFHLAAKEDVSHLTLTLGRFSAKDIFDNNAYANNPRTQFLNWALMANEAWDYPADSLGFESGFAAEFNQPQWTLRYGFFQMPQVANGVAQDENYLKAWGMVTEFERRYTVANHPGAARLLTYLNRAHMGSYQAALDNSTLPADIKATREYRYKYGVGLNVEQEITPDIGVFSRVGWSDGKNEGWSFTDVDRTATGGVSVKGGTWHRPDDTFGLAGVGNGISGVHQRFLAAGGTGILAGDGALSYGWEKILETYYNFQVTKYIHTTIDYQFIIDPAFNRARGPVSALAARLHWEF